MSSILLNRNVLKDRDGPRLREHSRSEVLFISKIQLLTLHLIVSSLELILIDTMSNDSKNNI